MGFALPDGVAVSDTGQLGYRVQQFDSQCFDGVETTEILSADPGIPYVNDMVTAEDLKAARDGFEFSDVPDLACVEQLTEPVRVLDTTERALADSQELQAINKLSSILDDFDPKKVSRCFIEDAIKAYNELLALYEVYEQQDAIKAAMERNLRAFEVQARGFIPVSYTHLTLPTSPKV